MKLTLALICSNGYTASEVARYRAADRAVVLYVCAPIDNMGNPCAQQLPKVASALPGTKSGTSSAVKRNGAARSGLFS